MLETGPGHYVSRTKARDEQYVHRNNLSPRTPCHVYLILRRFAQRVRKGRGGVHRTPSGFATSDVRPAQETFANYAFAERSGKGDETRNE